MNLVQKLKDQSVNGLTFTLTDLQVSGETKSGNFGFRVTCDNGKKVSFWASNMESVVEETTEGAFRVLPGVKFTKEPDEFGYYGLISADAKSSVWS